MDEVTLVTSSLHLIRKDFGLEDDSGKEEVSEDFNWLVSYLTDRIKFLIDNDFSGFLNAMYRIDIGEEKVKGVLSCDDAQNIPERLALLIIEREKQKVITRQQYSQS